MPKHSSFKHLGSSASLSKKEASIDQHILRKNVLKTFLFQTSWEFYLLSKKEASIDQNILRKNVQRHSLTKNILHSMSFLFTKSVPPELAMLQRIDAFMR